MELEVGGVDFFNFHQQILFAFFLGCVSGGVIMQCFSVGLCLLCQKAVLQMVELLNSLRFYSIDLLLETAESSAQLFVDSQPLLGQRVHLQGYLAGLIF